MQTDQTPTESNHAANQETEAALDDATCSACGQKPRRNVDYGDFSKYEVRCLIAEYCMSVTLGCTGWGVDFKTWVEIRGIAKHDGMFRLIRLPDHSPVDLIEKLDMLESELLGNSSPYRDGWKDAFGEMRDLIKSLHNAESIHPETKPNDHE